jgi:hypothetical protein
VQVEAKVQEYQEKLQTLLAFQKQSGKSARQVLKEQIERTSREIEKLKTNLSKHK